MTETYRQQQIIRARLESASARERWNRAKTRPERLNADFDLNFWSSKVAFLEGIGPQGPSPLTVVQGTWPGTESADEMLGALSQ